MTPTDIRIAMAEIDGYVLPFEKHWQESIQGWDLEDNRGMHLHNYPQDFNAIAEFRKRHITNSSNLNLDYIYELTKVCDVGSEEEWRTLEVFKCVDATTLQHCEALIKTLAPEKWKD